MEASTLASMAKREQFIMKMKSLKKTLETSEDKFEFPDEENDDAEPVSFKKAKKNKKKSKKSKSKKKKKSKDTSSDTSDSGR